MTQQTESSRETFELDFQTGFGRLRGRMQLPRKEMRLAELAWNLMKLDDQLVTMGVAKGTGPKAGGLQISCSQGCGACCRQLVPLSPPEAFMIADLVLGLPDERRNAVVDRFEQTRDTLQRAGIDAVAGLTRPRDEDLLDLTLNYFELGLPCPFLENEACSIYASRPSICREYLVTNPASSCAMIRHKPISRVRVPLALADYLSRLYALLVGGEPVTVPLPAALGWADQHWEEGQRRYDAKYLFTTLAGLFQSPPAKAG
jgi:Fe-S-cluster containining protein